MDPIEVHPVDVIERTADSKGRVTLGAEYAGETVIVGIVERQGNDDDLGGDQLGDDLAEAESTVRSIQSQVSGGGR